MIRYRQLIEENFLIDDAKTGKLRPFKFNVVQEMYYKILCDEYDIENKGLLAPIRENILKARREGFSSLILALFAADDILNPNPTETDVLSYKDEATATFRKRYRTYVLSYFAKENGITYEQILENINILEEVAKAVLAVDSDEITIAWNKAHFQCNTASARVGGRGGVRHKTLFSEVAFYPDTEKMLASEMIEATMRQTDIASGWIFCESTSNGIGTYQHRMWEESKKGRSRFRNRFFGTGEFYTEEEIEVIRSEYIDMDAFRRDYPMTEDDLFKGSLKNFTNEDELLALTGDLKAEKEIIYFMELQGQNGIDAAEIMQSELERLVRTHPKRALYVGIDEAKSIDSTVMVVLASTNMDLTGGVKGVEIDTTRGEFLADWFERNTNHWLVKRRFSRQTKSGIFTTLQVVIGDQLTKIPEWKVGKEWVADEYKHFYEQMIALEKEIIGNLLVVHHPKGKCNPSDHNYDECPYHDDYPDAWAMAEDVYVELNGVPKRDKKPEIPTVPNALSTMLNRPMMGHQRYSNHTADAE